MLSHAMDLPAMLGIMELIIFAWVLQQSLYFKMKLGTVLGPNDLLISTDSTISYISLMVGRLKTNSDNLFCL